MSETILIPGYLYWDGSKYILSPGTAGTVFTANGDLSGSPSTQKVIGLQTIPISSTPPTNGQVLTYNGTAWAPATAASGSFTASQDLSGTSTVQRVVGIQTIPVLSTAPTSGQVLTYNGSAWAPATAIVGAIAGAPYLQIGSLDGNANARILTAGSNITIADGGPGSTLTISSSGGGGSSVEPIFSRSLALHIGGLRSEGGLSESTTPAVGDVYTAIIGSEPVRIIYDPTVVSSFGPSLWIARFGASDVVRFDIGSGYIDVIPFDDIGTSLDVFDMTFGVSGGTNYLWVIDQSTNNLLIKISSIPQVGIVTSVAIPEVLSGVVFDTVNVHVVVAAGNNHLYTVDPTSLVVSSAHTIGVSGDSFFIAYPGNVFNETERVLLYAQGFLWISVYNAGTNTGKILQINPTTFATTNTYTPSGSGNNITFYSPVSDSAGAGFIFFIGTNNSTLASSVYRINVSTSTVTATLAVPSGNLASAATIGPSNTLWILSQSGGTNAAIQVTGLTTTPAIGVTQALYGTDPLLTDIVFDSNLNLLYVTDPSLDQMYRFPISGTPLIDVNITPLIGVGEWQPPSIYGVTTLVSGPATYVIPAIGTRIMADATGGAINLTMPASGTFAQVGVTNSAGNFATSNCTVAGNGSDTIENPTSPGTFSPSITLNVLSESIDWLYDLNQSRWKIVYQTGGGFTAGLDLSGTNTSQTVIGIQGQSVPTPTGTNTTLQWTGSAFTWAAGGGGYNLIQQNAVPLTTRTTFNIVSGGKVSDDVANTSTDLAITITDNGIANRTFANKEMRTNGYTGVQYGEVASIIGPQLGGGNVTPGRSMTTIGDYLYVGGFDQTNYGALYGIDTVANRSLTASSVPIHDYNSSTPGNHDGPALLIGVRSTVINSTFNGNVDFIFAAGAYTGASTFLELGYLTSGGSVYNQVYRHNGTVKGPIYEGVCLGSPPITTVIASGSDGVNLGTNPAQIFTGFTTHFPATGTIYVSVTGGGTVSVNYTSITNGSPSSFNGCTYPFGASGTINTGNAVATAPEVTPPSFAIIDANQHLYVVDSFGNIIQTNLTTTNFYAITIDDQGFVWMLGSGLRKYSVSGINSSTTSSASATFTQVGVMSLSSGNYSSGITFLFPDGKYIWGVAPNADPNGAVHFFAYDMSTCALVNTFSILDTDCDINGALSDGEFLWLNSFSFAENYIQLFRIHPETGEVLYKSPILNNLSQLSSGHAHGLAITDSGDVFQAYTDYDAVFGPAFNLYRAAKPAQSLRVNTLIANKVISNNVGPPSIELTPPPAIGSFTVVGQLGLVAVPGGILATEGDPSKTNLALTSFPVGVVAGGPWSFTLATTAQFDENATAGTQLGMCISNGVISGTSTDLYCGFYQGATLKVPSLAAWTETVNSVTRLTTVFADNNDNAGRSPYYLRIICDGTNFIFQSSQTFGYNWRSFASATIASLSISGTLSKIGFVLGGTTGGGTGGSAAVIFGFNMVTIPQLTVSTVSGNGTTATFTTTTSHGLITGSSVSVTGVVISGGGGNYNALYEGLVIVTGLTTFTMLSTSTGTYVSGGLITIVNVKY